MSAPQVTKTRRERRLAKRAERQGARRRLPRAGRRLSLGPLSVLGLVGGLAIVALAIVIGTRPTATPAATSAVTIVDIPAGLAANGVVLGRADAPVTIDLYEDFQCPACAAWGRNVFPSLASNEVAAGTVRIHFHDMAFLGPESTNAGRAAYAAGQQGRFWDMWTTLYANQGRENSGDFSRARLIAMADGLGLDVALFTTDMDSSAAMAAIDASRAAANRAGVTSTPTLIVDGQAFVGVQTYPDLAAAIATSAGQ